MDSSNTLPDSSMTLYTLPPIVEEPFLIIPHYLAALYDAFLDSVPVKNFEGVGISGIALAMNMCVSYYISTLFNPIF